MEKLVKGSAENPCANATCEHFHAAIELIGRRWNGVILRGLFGGADRFSTLRASIPEITDAMLAQRLRELEDAGLIVREVSGGRPIEVHYALTDIGARLAPIFNALGVWSQEWGATTSPARPGRRKAG